MGEDEAHHGRGIIQPVRVVADAGLVDDFDRAAERPVTLLDEGGVFRRGHRVIGIADDVDEGDAGLGQRLEAVDGIAGVGQGLGFVFEAVAFTD